MLEGQKFAYRGNRPWKNAWWQNFFDSTPQLTARRPFVVQKWPFKALFWEIRLADTDLAATRSYRQIEAQTLVFCGHQKTYPGRCGKGHFVVTLYPHLGEKTEFRLFLEGDSSWLTYHQDTFVVSFWSCFLHLIEQRKKVNPLVCKRSFGGRSLSIHQKMAI